MLDRTMAILGQSTSVWPLARRWIESVEKLLAADTKSLTVSNTHEGGMAEGVSAFLLATRTRLFEDASNNSYRKTLFHLLCTRRLPTWHLLVLRTHHLTTAGSWPDNSALTARTHVQRAPMLVAT